MTPEQINAMSAGREIDAAVAESLGYKVERWNEYAVILDAGVPGYPTVMDDDGKTILHEFPHHSMWVWPFSTDIACALKMQAEIEWHGLAGEYGKQLALLLSPQSYPFEWSNIYGANREEVFAIANASPLDRCKAALLVLAGRQDAARGEM